MSRVRLPVALAAESPEAAVKAFQRRLNGVLNRVLTRYRLELRSAGGELFYLAFLGPQKKEPVAVKLGGPWFLYLGQTLGVEKFGTNRFKLKILRYAYRLQASADIAEEPFVRFEYDGPETRPDFPYCRNHLQLHRDYHGVLPRFSPAKFHLPTGWVTVESVIRFAITDVRIRPLRTDWDPVLRESERKFREWIDTPPA